MCALLLKAAVPMLASAAATWQGKSVAEICTVYGVALPAAFDPHAAHHSGHDHAHHGHGHEHDHHQLASHAGDHCALQGLAALALPDFTEFTVPRASHALAVHPHACMQACTSDDCALWVARQKHGPPSVA